MKQTKVTKIIVTAELEIEDIFLHDKNTLTSDILGSFVKVKGGLYENLAFGFITDVKL